MALTRAPVNGARSVAGPPVIEQRIRVPVWAVLAGWAGRLLARLLVLALVRHSVATAILAGLVAVRVAYGWPALAALLAAVSVGALGWWRLHPASFAVPARWVRGRWRLSWVYRRRWRHVMVGAGLVRRAPTSLGEHIAYTEYLPRIRKIRSDGLVDRLRVELLYGQHPDQYARQAEALRHAFRARHCAVREEPAGFVWLDFAYTDPLAHPVPALPIPAAAEAVDLAALPLGRRDDGQPWTLGLLGTHLLVAGAGGAGKGSVLWSLIRAVAPLVHTGTVQLWIVDPKGGMELAFGAPMFTRFATDSPTHIADLLDDAVQVMRDRTHRLRGRTRQHTPTPAEPLILVVVDEIAALTAYLADRDFKRRIGAALPLLLSQGRAPGVSVIAAPQDPRKEVLPFRDLFPTRIALRLAEAEQVDMVLGDGVRDRGALADKIPPSQPGVGYVLVDGAPDPARVRAGWVTDDDIHTMATHWPTPTPAEFEAGEIGSLEAALVGVSGGEAA